MEIEKREHRGCVFKVVEDQAFAKRILKFDMLSPDESPAPACHVIFPFSKKSGQPGTFMQLIFVIVLLSDGFLGESMEDHAAAAQQWRAGSAHDVK